MDLIRKASNLGYMHYTEFTIEELDKLPLENSNKQIEYFFIQKWLRDEHNIDISIIVKYSHYKDGKFTKEKTYLCRINYIEEDFIKSFFIRPKNFIQFKTYEEALEISLQEALKLI